MVDTDIYSEFNRLLDSELSFDEIREWIDRKVSSPGIVHFIMFQEAIASKRIPVMRRVLGRQVSIEDAMEDYQDHYRRMGHLAYIHNYIVPLFCNPEKRREYLSLPETDRKWIDAEVDMILELGGDTHDLTEIVFRTSPELARSIRKILEADNNPLEVHTKAS